MSSSVSAAAAESAPPGADASLAAMRHSCAHLLAAALQELYPGTLFGTGPATEDGFHYDVQAPVALSEEDLPRIEQRMREIQARDLPIEAEVWPVERAQAWMLERGQAYKLELIERLAQPALGIYRLGDFIDLCKGPHVARTGDIGPFRLVSLAGAYWRGDASRPQLTRIRGLCFDTAEALERRLWELEEARRRDHRVLGRQLNIFTMAEDVGAGLPLWLPEGTAVRLELEHLARQFEGREGYRPVCTPALARESLYLKSGHLPYYREDMYAPIEIDAQRYYLRPMCCPHHHQVYLSRPRSYRELPLRIAEYGQVFRYEASGGLSGLMRTRGFCQNDAHIYCREDQVLDEFVRVMRLHARYYGLLGIQDYHMRLSLPDFSTGAKYVDDRAGWDHAVALLRQAMQASGLPCVEAPGEAAFYGPKIDFMIRSAIGQSYAISTNQLDFVAARRFGLSYTGDDGQAHPVFVIHRAPLGSHERFTAFLLEHFAGALPTWLSPVQVMVIPVSDRHLPLAREVLAQLQAAQVPSFDGCLRVELDDSPERMQKKILRAQQRKVPYMLILGDCEAREGSVSVRSRDGRTRSQALEGFIAALRQQIGERALAPC